MNLLSMPPAHENIVALFVGESGSGKSCAIASFAKAGPLLMMDFDKRAKGILGLRSVLGDDVLKNIEVKQYDISNSFQSVDNELMVLVQAAQNGKCPYRTVVLESVVTMETCFMNMVDAIAQQQRGTGIATKAVGGIRVYSPAHYKFAAQAFRQVRDLRLLQLRGVNVIVSGWVVNKWDKPTERDDQGNEIVKQYANNIVVGKKLLLTEKMCEEVPGLFDEVYEFYKEETQFASQPVAHGVKFNSSIAKTAIEPLKKINKLDLTNKSFYDEYTRVVQKG